MGRTVFVGDIHGCRRELEALLDKLAFGSDDRLICVGDLVVRGPDPDGTLDLLANTGARSVRGNHEDRLLRIRKGGLAITDGAQQECMSRLRERHFQMLESLPLWIELPEHNTCVVHAGIVPSVLLRDQNPRTLMYVRTLDGGGQPLERRDGKLWGDVYAGPRHIVFGHNALSEPQMHRFATGLDTGAVYGGALTAMVLRAGETPPPPENRKDILVSVPARERYAEH